MKIEELYLQLIAGWDERNADKMTNTFAEDGQMIGFDGSLATGRKEIHEHLSFVFDNNPTPPFVKIIKSIRPITEDTTILRAIVGMIPPGKTELEPSVNAHQTMVAQKIEDEWKVQLFQNTPAQFLGRPKLVEQMTEELKNSEGYKGG